MDKSIDKQYNIKYRDTILQKGGCIMEVKNYMEIMVKEKLDELLDERTDICTCPQCRAEMATFALNNLKPRYITSKKGEIYSKLEEMDAQINADVSKIIIKAIKIVSTNPRHK